MGNYGDAFGIALAEQLRAERSAARLSQRKLAELTGMSEQTVMRYLNGTRDIPMSNLADLAHALGLSVQTVVERAEQRIPGAGNVTPIDVRRARQDDLKAVATPLDDESDEGYDG